MSGHKSLELDDTIAIGLLNTTQESCIKVARVVVITIATGRNAGVDPSRIAMPKIKIDSRDGLASGGVNDLDVQRQGNTSLILSNVFADQLAVDKIRSLSNLLLKGTRGVVSE